MVDIVFDGSVTAQGVTMGAGPGSSSTNTAVGKDALSANVSGSFNTAVGQECLDALDTGERNTALGAGAGGTLTDGIRNVFLGYSAGGASNGTHNVLVGTYCAQNLTTGYDNVMLGYNIGNGSLGVGAVLTSASENVFIGREASVDAVDGSGCIALGYKAVAQAATGTGTGQYGPGVAIGSSAAPVGFRGDGSIFPDTTAPTMGYLRIKVNGTNYKLALLDDA